MWLWWLLFRGANKDRPFFIIQYTTQWYWWYYEEHILFNISVVAWPLCSFYLIFQSWAGPLFKKLKKKKKNEGPAYGVWLHMFTVEIRMQGTVPTIKICNDYPDANLMTCEELFAWLGQFKKILNSMTKNHSDKLSLTLWT